LFIQQNINVSITLETINEDNNCVYEDYSCKEFTQIYENISIKFTYEYLFQDTITVFEGCIITHANIFLPTLLVMYGKLLCLLLLLSGFLRQISELDFNFVWFS
jgi:hypothetical protein